MTTSVWSAVWLTGQLVLGPRIPCRLLRRARRFAPRFASTFSRMPRSKRAEHGRRTRHYRCGATRSYQSPTCQARYAKIISTCSFLQLRLADPDPQANAENLEQEQRYSDIEWWERVNDHADFTFL